MGEAHANFVGSIPGKYDEHLGPLFFEYYAADLARRIVVAPGGRILETACGTGIATGHLRNSLPASVEIVATDPNEPMLDHARGKGNAFENVRFENADAIQLPFDDGAFDAVVCQFGLMFLPDKLAGMREAARVLKPGGAFAFNVWDSLEANPIVRVAYETISGFFDSEPPSFYLTPFGYHNLDVIRNLLQEAGFAHIDISVVPSLVERPSALHVATGLVEGNPTINDVVKRAKAAPDVIVEAVAHAIRAEFGDAPLRTPLQAIVVVARLP